MLTLQELKKITDMPGDREKLPTAKQLRITGLVVAKEQLGRDAEISAYQNGCALYRVGRRSTVFFLHPCRDYYYLSDGGAVCLPEQFFERERWYLRLMLEGEDRLAWNREKKEQGWNISYNAISEDWDAMGEWPGSAAERLERQETVEEMMQLLTEKQKTVICGYYMQGKTQAQLARELGVSRPAVKDSLVHAVGKIRKRYLMGGSESGNGTINREGLL